MKIKAKNAEFDHCKLSVVPVGTRLSVCLRKGIIQLGILCVLFLVLAFYTIYAQHSFETIIDVEYLYERGLEIEEVSNNGYVVRITRQIEQTQNYTRQFTLLYLLDQQGSVLDYDSLMRADTVFMFYNMLSYGENGLIATGLFGFLDDQYSFIPEDSFICLYNLSNNQFDLQWIMKYEMNQNNKISYWSTIPMMKPGTDTCFIGRTLINANGSGRENFFFCFDPQTGDSLMIKSLQTDPNWRQADLLFSGADTSLHLLYQIGTYTNNSNFLLRLNHGYEVTDTLLSHPHLNPWYAKVEGHSNGNIYIGGEANWYDWNSGIRYKYYGVYSYSSSFEPINSIYLTHPDTTAQTAWAETIRVGPDGHIFIASNYHYHGFPFSGTYTYLYLAKLDEDLNLVWEKYIGGERHYNTNALAATSDGGVIVSGYGYDKEFPETQGFAWICKLTSDGYVGVEERNMPVQSALLYPNPAGDFIFLQSNHKQGRIEFYDLSGRLHQSEMTKTGKQQISLQGLGKGTYIAVFRVNNQIIHSQKILKHK
jgi:hypothetical protein